VVLSAHAQPEDVVVADLDRTLLALADPTRRRVVDLLRVSPRRAGELADAVGTSPPAMSRHLRVLRMGGLVREDHDGEDARVRHGWSALRPDHPARHGNVGADFDRMIGQWWGALLTGLREHVAARQQE